MKIRIAHTFDIPDWLIDHVQEHEGGTRSEAINEIRLHLDVGLRTSLDMIEETHPIESDPDDHTP